MLWLLGCSGCLAEVAVSSAVGAAGEQGGVLGFVEGYVGAEGVAGLAAAVVAGAVYAAAQDGIALEAAALIFEPVLGSAARALDVHLRLPPFCRRVGTGMPVGGGGKSTRLWSNGCFCVPAGSLSALGSRILFGFAHIAQSVGALRRACQPFASAQRPARRLRTQSSSRRLVSSGSS